jgi:alkylation response protein AidB-like acyl-CoA dehydrogenase
VANLVAGISGQTVSRNGIQIHGGYGYTTEFLPERWWRDLRLMPIGGGTSEIMTNILRKELQRR